MPNKEEGDSSSIEDQFRQKMDATICRCGHQVNIDLLKPRKMVLCLPQFKDKKKKIEESS